VPALGEEFAKLAPAVLGHLRQAAGASLLVDRLRRSWRRGGPVG
jgi:hypothetical protein